MTQAPILWRSDSGQRGTVLILVLWALALLTMIAGYYAVEAKIRRNLGQQEWDGLSQRAAVGSLLMLLNDRIAPEDEDPQTAADQGHFLPDGRWYTVTIGSQRLDFALEDEQGKVDLNTTPEETLRKVVQGLFPDNPDGAEALVDAIIDWRDADSVPLPQGAEDEAYKAEGRPYLPANGPFRLVDELLLVHGVTTDLFYGPFAFGTEDREGTPAWVGGLRDLFTVYNKTGNVVREYAPWPLQQILGDQAEVKPAARGVLRLKCRAGGLGYLIFWTPGTGGKGFQILHWAETPVLEESEVAWSENAKS